MLFKFFEYCNGVFYLSEAKKGTYNLLNVSGKLVGRGSIDTILDFSQLANGIYFLELNENGGVSQHHKLIIK